MDIQQTEHIIKACIRTMVPGMLWGPPGVGKSSILEQVCKQMGMKHLDLRLAQIDPTDLRGIPVPNRETKRVDWFYPSFWPASYEEGENKGKGVDGPGVIFLDEIDKAPVSVKNAALQLVLDRRVGDYCLPTDWAIIAAGNREEDGALSMPIGTALSNRMIHVEVEADIEVWAKWARKNDVNEQIIGFLLANTDKLYNNTGHHAFPTPRSWVAASNLIKDNPPADRRKELIKAAVGEGVVHEYEAWVNIYSKVDPEAILTGTMPVLEGKDQSYRYAVTLSVAFYANKRGVSKYMGNICKFLDLLGPELRVCFLRQQSPKALEEMATAPELETIVADIMSIL